MASLSEKLRRERELRGISLKQISEDTKIGVRFLEALEQDRLDLIPGEFYRRSYLRAYARYLGLDEDRAVNAYLYANRETESSAEGDGAGDRASRPGFAAIVALAAVALAVAALWFFGGRGLPTSDAVAPGGAPVAIERAAAQQSGGSVSAQDPGRISSPPPSMQSTSSVPSLDVRSTRVASPTADREAREGGDNGALRLRVEVGAACWLEIRGDGEVLTTGLKEVGFRDEFSAEREVRLWLGNAGGVSLSINERPLRPLGTAGQVRKDVAITPENFMEFVVREAGTS